MPVVEIWTDGACKGNPGVGGWGAVLRWGDDTKEVFGGEPETTNNRMELTAVIEALCAAPQAVPGAAARRQPLRHERRPVLDAELEARMAGRPPASSP